MKELRVVWVGLNSFKNWVWVGLCWRNYGDVELMLIVNHDVINSILTKSTNDEHVIIITNTSGYGTMGVSMGWWGRKWLVMDQFGPKQVSW